jgi:Transposase DDE domain
LFGLLCRNAHSSIRKISHDRATQKAAYRFINNKKVTEEILIDEMCSRHTSICADRHVLCVQDTTEMNFYSHRHRLQENSGLGRLDCLSVALGFKMHSTLMLDGEHGNVLGFSDVQLWHRPSDMPTRIERKYKTLPIEQKESYKWIKAANACKERLQAASTITFIEDREGDFYEQLSSIANDRTHYIIRSRNNRNTANNSKAWDTLAQQPAAGSYTFTLQTDHRKNRIKQQIILQVRYSTITITRSPSLKYGKKYPATVTLNIVEAFDANNKDGISWKLLTTHAVNSFEDARQIVHWYSQRWTIEQMHRLLKHKGFQIEESELESGWALRKLCVLMLSALIRIIQMNIAYNEPEGGQDINEVYDKNELKCLENINQKIQGKTIKQQNHNNPQKLKWATWIIARLGGWKAYQSQGPPGIIVLKRGLDKFYDIYYGWQLAKDVGTR